LPWAGSILRDANLWDQTLRADRLYERAMEYIDRVAGPDNAHGIESLRRIHRARIKDYPVSRRDFDAVALEGLNAMYPQKCAEVGEPTLRALIARGREEARRRGAETDLGV